MKSFGFALLITGILFIGLSGLEKIIIYASLHDRAGDYQVLKTITPNEIWNVITLTFAFGIILSVIGLIMSSWRFLVRQNQLIREANRQFEKEHMMNKDNEKN
ncbi:hypothetical protein [Cohnella sp. GCM10027633]|uniref:hypothetical protein n=1 Tax=unclassified Cohnella TaxID=2636738 RepID=UPI003638E657